MIAANVTFMQGNAMDIEFDKTYDNMMMMGLLTYIMEDENAEKIVQKVAAALKRGGRLIIKDSLNLGEKDLFAYDISNGYQAIYRTKANYIRIFEKFGLAVEKEKIFEEQQGSFGNRFISLGLIWKKL